MTCSFTALQVCPTVVDMRTFGTKKKLLTVALVCCSSIAGFSNAASATCTIASSRLQQVSEREIVAFIDGRCTKEFGESGYYTKISPDVFGEVMSVYGNRPVDQNGYGWQASYGYYIVFPESSETYAAGVWIADADGVVHSSEMTIRNSFFPTTTTSSTSTTSTTIVAGSQNASAETTNQPAPATTLSDLIADDGVEDEFAELLVRAIGTKWEIKADSSYPNTPMTVKFRKSGSRTITWNFVTTNDGTRRILTSRNLSGGTLILAVQGNVVDRISIS